MTETDFNKIADAADNSIMNPIEERDHVKRASQFNRGALLWVIVTIVIVGGLITNISKIMGAVWLMKTENAESITISWEFMYTRSMFETDDMSEQGKLLSTVAGLLDEGTLVTTRQKTLTGLTPGNIQAMHIKQESGTMMGKQVLIL